MKRRLARGTLLGAAITLGACSGGTPAPTHVLAPPPTDTSEPPPAAAISPARWFFHPQAPSEALTTLSLPDGMCILTADGGQRWRAQALRSDGACGGKAVAASDLAPENLIGVIRKSPTAWLFVGTSGTLYEAADPLGPFARTIPAPERLEHVAGAGDTVLATTFTGKLLRLEPASGWQPLPLPAGKAADVAVAPDGHALVLTLPEALLFSDDGRTFRPAPGATPIGAYRLGRSATSPLAAQGQLSSLAFLPQEDPPFQPDPSPVLEGSATVELDPGPLPQATAINEGRAVLDGDRYLEVLAPKDGEDDYALAQGRIDGPLSRAPVPGTKGCGSVKLGARGKYVVTACARMVDDAPMLDVQRSSDGGDHFGAPLRFALQEADLVMIAVSAEGHALITGACKPTSKTESTCTATAPLRVRWSDDHAASELSASPPLTGVAKLPAFSLDGGSAYFLGRRAKDERLALFVSHDGGATFAERPLDVQSLREHRPALEDADEVAAGEDRGDDLELEISDLTALSPGEDGTLGFVLGTSAHGFAYLRADEDGRSIRLTFPPSSHSMLSGAGRHAIALALTGSDDTTVQAWESLDGGASWNDITATWAVRAEVLNGPMSFACSTAGCLLGATIARLGWGGQAESPPAEGPTEREREKVPAVRTPLVCELDPRTRWTRIEHVDPISAYGQPTVDQLMRGRAAWSVLQYDRAKASVSAVVATLPEHGEGEAKVTTRVLMGPSPGRMALDVSHQMEGYAVVRVRAADRLPAPMRDVEVAWENFMDGTSGRARIPDAGPFAPNDTVPDNGGWLLDTALVSVSPGALFVRPHAAATKDPRTFLIDTKGKLSTFDYPTWPPAPSGASLELRDDAALIDGQILAVGVLSDDREGQPLSMLLARRGPQAWETRATALAPGNAPVPGGIGRAARSDWTYAGGKLGVVTVASLPQDAQALAAFHPFRGDGSFGAPSALPTPFDLPDPPRPCKAADRATTARIEARMFLDSISSPSFPGTRHPVLVTEAPTAKGQGGEPMLLLTAGVVLHGTPASPCVAGWEAWSVARKPLTAVILGDPSQAWVFRRALDQEPAPLPVPGSKAPKPAASSEPAIEYRPMTCRFDAGAKVPENVFAEQGTFRWVR